MVMTESRKYVTPRVLERAIYIVCISTLAHYH
jgi:hypothetical protein